MMRTAGVILLLFMMFLANLFPFGARLVDQLPSSCSTGFGEFVYVYDILHPLATIKALLESDYALSERLKDQSSPPKRQNKTLSITDLLVPAGISFQSPPNIPAGKAIPYLACTTFLLLVHRFWQLKQCISPPGSWIVALFLLYLIALAKSHLPEAVARMTCLRSAQSCRIGLGFFFAGRYL